MRFLIINIDYPEFLGWLYSRHPGLEEQSYEEQMRVRAESLFGVADFYSSNLRKLGHEAYDVHANNEDAAPRPADGQRRGQCPPRSPTRCAPCPSSWRAR